MKNLLLLLSCIAACLFASAQEKAITGTVKNEQGEPVPYAVITIKQTNRQVVADGAGAYSIKAAPGQTLMVTSVGMTDKIISVGNSTTVDITMQSSPAQLSTVTVGTRNIRRTATETAVPVDIIPVSRVANQLGQVDINQLLQFVAPSFNSNKQSGADGADHVDPATLRGLGPDQTLVLINGKRRHQSALVNLYGTRGRGNTGTDLNAIPAAAIERIEILRDGASAQYGSDAIAGVINIVLKSSTSLTANVMAGEYITGYGKSLNSEKGKVINDTTDGRQYNANINYGFALKNSGYFNITADYLKKNKTRRRNFTDLYPDSYRNRFGDMSLTNSSVIFNSLFPSKGKSAVYAFGGFGIRKGDAFAWTRDPDDDRNVKEIYPNGFDPHIQSKIHDGSLSLGVRSRMGEWNSDINVTGGLNRFHYEVDKTLNASLGAASPTHFDAGGFQLAQYVATVDFSRQFKTVAHGLNLAFGAEYRNERYKIFAGEEKSYKGYALIANGDTTYPPAGSQGFPGFQPHDVTNQNRSNVGGYIDGELDISKSVLLTGAVRLENYSDFGFTHNYKMSLKVKLDENISWRSSVTTGFRAPSLPQSYFSSTFTNVVAGKIVDQVLAPNNSELAKRVGIPELKQERSVSISTGLAARTSNLTVTLDGYYVNIKDRIVLTGLFFDTDDKIGSILQSMNISAAQFFTNAVNTRTYGLDAIVTHNMRLGKARLITTLAGNFNMMEITKIKTTELLKGKEDSYFDKREQSFLLASAPPAKVNGSWDLECGRFNALLRLNYFAGIQLMNWSYSEYDYYKDKVTTDISLGMKIAKPLLLTVGGSNIFDVYPNHKDPGLSEGGGMWDAVQMGFGGAFYFVRVGVKL